MTENQIIAMTMLAGLALGCVLTLLLDEVRYAIAAIVASRRDRKLQRHIQQSLDLASAGHRPPPAPRLRPSQQGVDQW